VSSPRFMTKADGRIEDARVLAGLRSGDGPLSIRARPSSIKRDCDRRATSTGEKRPVNVHAKSRLTPGCLCQPKTSCRRCAVRLTVPPSFGVLAAIG
jgi:hypothetical protein